MIRGLRPILRRHNVSGDEIVEVAKRCQWGDFAIARATEEIATKPLTHGEWHKVPKRKRLSGEVQKDTSKTKGQSPQAPETHPYGNGQGVWKRMTIGFSSADSAGVKPQTGANGYRNPYGNVQPDAPTAEGNRRRGIAPVDMRRGVQGRRGTSMLGNPFSQGGAQVRTDKCRMMLTGQIQPPKGAYAGCTGKD